jgi:excinuclease ABC subunit A
VVDLGPEGGAGGGRLVACGPPSQVARSDTSHTGRVLRELSGYRPKTASWVGEERRA